MKPSLQHIHQQRQWQPLFFVALATILMVVFSVAFDAWAAPENSPLRQSVPTKTPTPEGATGKTQQTVATPVRPSPTPIPPPTPEPTIVPESSGGGSFLLIGLILLVVALAAVAVFVIYRRRK